MGRGHECVAGGEHFSTKKALKKRCQDIKDSYNRGEALTGDDLNVMIDVLKHHPDYEEKRGSSMDGIYVDAAPEYPMPSGDTHQNSEEDCFWVDRTFTDEDDVDFSYLKCIDGVDWSDTLPEDDNSEESEDASDDEAETDGDGDGKDGREDANSEEELGDTSAEGGDDHE